MEMWNLRFLYFMVIVGFGLAEPWLADLRETFKSLPTMVKRNVPLTCYSCDSTKSVDCLVNPELFEV